MRATGTGKTTGHIASIQVFNPSSAPQTFELNPCYIASGGKNQPYLVPGSYAVTIAPGATANLAIDGYCTDIHRPPVEYGSPLNTASHWPTASQSTGVATLLDACNRIASAYDSLKATGAITTPFSGNPEKEREAVIQQTFWIYTASKTDKPYTKEDFRKNTIKQFEASTGQSFSQAPAATQKNIEQGVVDFWTVFEAVGALAKVPGVGGATTDAPIEISVRDANCECGEVTLKVKAFIKDPFRKEVEAKALDLSGGANTRDTLELDVLPNDQVRLEISDLVAKCTECNLGECSVSNITVTINSKGMTENKTETVAEAGGTYSTATRAVEALAKDKKAAENPVRMYITVKYTCSNAKCSARTCEKSFEVTIKRRF